MIFFTQMVFFFVRIHPAALRFSSCLILNVPFVGFLFYDDLMEKCAAFIVSRLLVQFVFGIIPTNARTCFVFSPSSLWISSLLQTKTKQENFSAKNVLEHAHFLFRCSIFVTIKIFQHIPAEWKNSRVMKRVYQESPKPINGAILIKKLNGSTKEGERSIPGLKNVKEIVAEWNCQ